MRNHYIDTHTHIDFYDNPHDIAKRYNYNEIFTLFMTYLPEIFEKHLHDFNSYEYIRLALGFHPAMVLNYKFNKELFIKNLKKTFYIGEIGLDYSITKDVKLIEKQLDIFSFITKVAAENKILSIHSRKAESETLDVLRVNKVKHAIFHWYSGGLSVIDRILNEGYFFSVNHKMTQTKSGKKILSKIPLDRLLIETDGPFVKYNGNVLSPEMVKYTYKELSNIYKCVDIKEVVFENFLKLLKSRNEVDV